MGEAWVICSSWQGSARDQDMRRLTAAAGGERSLGDGNGHGEKAVTNAFAK
jgi:hypothetical protein